MLDRLLKRLVQPQPAEAHSPLHGGNKLRLHLGCGRTILADWVNVDVQPLPGVDAVADFDNCAAVPLPFADNSVAEFQANHVIEHLAHPLPFMQELHRIAETDARALFRVPYGSSDDALEDPTHRRAYFMNSFLYFGQPAYWRADYGYRGDWEVTRVTLAVDGATYHGRTHDETLRDVRTLRNVVSEMTVELRAVKPARPASRELLLPPTVEFNLL